MLGILADLRRGATMAELADKYKTHRRTMGRNIRDLQSAGFRLTYIEEGDSNERRWYAKRLNEDLIRLSQEGVYE
ncbi:MAG: hypothetical protein ACO1RA_02360 [Planctomycetaceae bacterium]